MSSPGLNQTDALIEQLEAALNPRQLEAVTYGDGPLLVLAGAGSGKTRVLTFRVAYLVAASDIPLHDIMAVTFTNKAAGEMKERLGELLGSAVDRMWVGTFHSLCARVLRRHLDAIGIRGDFVIYDADDSLRLVKRIQNDLAISTTDYPPRQIRGSISRAKNDLIDVEIYDQRARGSYQHVVTDIYKKYEKRLRSHNALDFDDLLVMPVRLFEERPDILDLYRNRFRYLLVDEYQDTNHAQYILLSMLASAHRNLCVVGDDDQSIYRWRGAQVRNILEFESEYPDAKVVRLERNYRSTANILRAASGVVTNNVSRKSKRLWTDREPGAPVVVVQAIDERDEATQVARRVLDLRTKGHSLGDQVVLYRINAQSRAFEETLTSNGIPYRIIGGLRFYERREIKDILAYLRVAFNPLDELSLSRIINVPPRGVGERSLQQLRSFAEERGITLFDAVLICREDDPPMELDLRGRARAGLKALGELLADLRSKIQDHHVGELTAATVKTLQIIEKLEEERSLEAEGRIENIKELLAATQAYQGSDGKGSTGEFLEEVSLVTQVDEAEFGGELLTLMTLHCAKGLEFPVVFIVGVEDGLLPWHRGLKDPEELEEERRLFYVGMTRAKERLVLTYASSRYQGGFGMGSQGVSRFLKEIPSDCISKGDFSVRSTPRWRKPSRPKPQPRIEGEAVLDYSSSQVPPSVILAMGKRVKHPEYGTGLVVARHGFGSDLEVDVRFSDGGIIRFPAEGSGLKPLGFEE